MLKIFWGICGIIGFVFVMTYSLRACGFIR